MEKDINDVFDDILLAEEKIIEKAYEKGFEKGLTDYNPEGYHLGFHRGAELGAEIGFYSAVLKTITKDDQAQNSKAIKSLNSLKELLVSFPKHNSEEVDILSLIQDIRVKYKKVCAQLKLNAAYPLPDSLSF